MNKQTDKILHFSLGPVQGFVAQARRTRDLWGGSFLLSWLAGHAMNVVIEKGGRIIFPIVHDNTSQPIDPLLKAIMQKGIGQPRIGTVPNRFKAIVPKDFDPRLCSDAVKQKWNELCQVIWMLYVDPIKDDGQDTAGIWQRQTANFWEISWACDFDPGDQTDGAWLDRRKNWRDHRPPDEGGDHCMVMGDWQELSGYVRSTERVKQDQFWQKFRSKSGVSKLDLRDDERLCAIALVKRLFPKVALQTIGWSMDIRNWPSTSYMAALHWIPDAWETDKNACLKFSELVQSYFAEDVFGERDTRIKCLEEISAKDSTFKKFAGLDGNVFQLHALSNEKIMPLNESAAPSARRELTTALTALINKTKSNIGITSYYALLVMDGDSMGAQLRDHSEEVSKGLAIFTSNIEQFVAKHNGVTVYAGGDDVLAMFSLDDAISAAHELRKAYLDSFDNVAWASISASIVYAHHHQPLRSVLQQAHQQLDKVAKDQNGRDSIALAVIKGGDINASWVSCWEPTSNYFPAMELNNMANQLRKDQQFSSRFLYSIRERFKDLITPNGVVASGIDISKILLAEYIKNREMVISRNDAQEVVESLIKAISAYPKGNPYPVGTVLQPAGPIVLRFLANRGVHE